MEAKLLDWSDLHEGLVVWEEWMCGAGTQRSVVAKIKGDVGVLRRGEVIIPIKRWDREWRYWDAEPTDEQRESTAW